MEHMNKPRASPPINITPPLTHCFLQRNDTRSRNSSIRDRSRLAPTIGGPDYRWSTKSAAASPHTASPPFVPLLAPRVSGARALILAACHRHCCRPRQWSRRYRNHRLPPGRKIRPAVGWGSPRPSRTQTEPSASLCLPPPRYQSLPLRPRHQPPLWSGRD